MCNAFCEPDKNIHAVLDFVMYEQTIEEWKEDLPFRSFTDAHRISEQFHLEYGHHGIGDLQPILVLDINHAEAEVPEFAKELGHGVPVLLTLQVI